MTQSDFIKGNSVVQVYTFAPLTQSLRCQRVYFKIKTKVFGSRQPGISLPFLPLKNQICPSQFARAAVATYNRQGGLNNKICHTILQLEVQDQDVK